MTENFRIQRKDSRGKIVAACNGTKSKSFKSHYQRKRKVEAVKSVPSTPIPIIAIGIKKRYVHLSLCHFKEFEYGVKAFVCSGAMNSNAGLWKQLKGGIMSGWIKLHRSILDHWLYRTQANDRREAWETILFTVTLSLLWCLVKGQLYECGRGQSLLSLNSWAEKVCLVKYSK